MSAQPFEQLTIDTELAEQQAANERHLQAVPDLEAGAEAEANLNDNIRWSNEHIAEGDIPNASTLANMSRATADIITNDDGSYSDKDGNALDKDQVDEFLVNSEPNNWMLNDEDRAGYQLVSDAKSAGDLTDAQKSEMRGMQTRDDVPVEKAFANYREASNKRLALSEELANMLGEDKTYESDQSEGIGDIVKIAKNGRGQRDGNKFISNQNMEQIEANQDQIREGLDEWTTAVENGDVKAARPDFANIDAQGRGHRDGDQKFLSKQEAESIKENEDLIHDKLPEWKAAQETETEEALVRPEGIDEDAWNMLSEDEQKAAIEVMAEQAKTDAETEETDDGTITDEEIAAAEANPATATTKGLRGRIKRIQERAYNRLLTMYNRVTGKTSDPETTKKRRSIVAYAIGATAIATAVAGAYAAHKGVGGGGSGSGAHEAAAAAGHGAGVEAVSHAHIVVRLAHGDTVWAAAREHLGGHPTNNQIFHETQRILDLNHLSWKQARDNLKAGNEITIS